MSTIISYHLGNDLRLEKHFLIRIVPCLSLMKSLMHSYLKVKDVHVRQVGRSTN